MLVCSTICADCARSHAPAMVFVKTGTKTTKR